MWFRRYPRPCDPCLTLAYLQLINQRIESIMTDTSRLVAAAARSKVATDKLIALVLDLQAKLVASDPAGAAQVQASIDAVTAGLDTESAAEEGAVNPVPAAAPTAPDTPPATA